MSGRSPIDSLRRLAPVSDSDAAAVFAVSGREELLDAVTGRPFGRAARPRPMARRRRLVLALAVLALTAIATAATWVAISRNAPARETTSVECVINGVDTIIPSTSGDPAHDCAVEWKRELGKAGPRLVAYDNGFGGITVLPHTQTPPAGYKRLASQEVALIELQTSLDDVIHGLNSSCLDPASATSLAKAKLRQFGFVGWTVSVRDPQSAAAPGMCTSIDIVDPVARSITLAGVGGLSAGGSALKLADKLRPLTRSCESLPAAVSSVRATASSLGLSESARGYDLNAVTDKSLRCAAIYETVGGTIFLTVRGPRG
jgi:hypothetical protein